MALPTPERLAEIEQFIASQKYHSAANDDRCESCGGLWEGDHDNEGIVCEVVMLHNLLTALRGAQEGMTLLDDAHDATVAQLQAEWNIERDALQRRVKEWEDTFGADIGAAATLWQALKRQVEALEKNIQAIYIREHNAVPDEKRDGQEIAREIITIMQSSEARRRDGMSDMKSEGQASLSDLYAEIVRLREENSQLKDALSTKEKRTQGILEENERRKKHPLDAASLTDDGHIACPHIQAWMEALDSRLAQAREALKNLVDKLRECQPYIDTAFLLQQTHGFPYAGPNYAEEVKAALRALEEPK